MIHVIDTDTFCLKKENIQNTSTHIVFRDLDEMTALRLNCRWSGGRQNLEGITAETTLEDLTAQIWSLSGIEPSDQILRSGYPPTLIDMEDLSVSLSTAGITNGSLIAVETKSKKEFQTDETPIVDLTKVEAASQSKVS